MPLSDVLRMVEEHRRSLLKMELRIYESVESLKAIERALADIDRLLCLEVDGEPMDDAAQEPPTEEPEDPTAEASEFESEEEIPEPFATVEELEEAFRRLPPLRRHSRVADNKPSSRLSCIFCYQLRAPIEIYHSHPVRDPATGIIVCPVLKAYSPLLQHNEGAPYLLPRKFNIPAKEVEISDLALLFGDANHDGHR